MGKFDRVLLASDFDNTLVYTQEAMEAGTEIPPMSARNREALRYFIENGGFFSVATGRALPAFLRYAGDLPCNAPCVIANGAALYDFRTGEYVSAAFFTDAIYAQADELLARFPDLTFEIYHDGGCIHALHPNRFVANHERLTHAGVQTVRSFREVSLPIIKLLFEEERERLEEVLAFLRSRSWGEEYELIFSGDHLLEMTVRGANKGGMVLRLAELLGVQRRDIYCVGDHLNDLPMLAAAAVGFAPANSVPEVLQSGARMVCHCRDGALADVVDILDESYG